LTLVALSTILNMAEIKILHLTKPLQNLPGKEINQTLLASGMNLKAG
jgi:hypothetical protein